MVFDVVTAGPDDGEVVLLLHGFPQSKEIWAPQVEALAAAGFRPTAFDQRGYSPGARPEGVEHYRIGNLVEDALAWPASGRSMSSATTTERWSHGTWRPSTPTAS